MKKTPGIPISRYFILSVEYDCISKFHLQAFFRFGYIQGHREEGTCPAFFCFFKILKFYNHDLFSCFSVCHIDISYAAGPRGSKFLNETLTTQKLNGIENNVN